MHSQFNAYQQEWKCAGAGKFIKKLAGNAEGDFPLNKGRLGQFLGLKKKFNFFHKKLHGIEKALLLQPRSSGKIDEEDEGEKERKKFRVKPERS